MTRSQTEGSEDLPEIFYIFVNQFNPITEHNFKLTGRFASAAFSGFEDQDFFKKYLDGSARYLPYGRVEMDQQAFSPLLTSAINDYRIEHDAELARKKINGKLPSRLSAIYAFGDLESCTQASQKYGWNLDSIQRFRLLPNALNRAIKVNMEHVSIARMAYKWLGSEDAESLWEGYWCGEAECSVELPTSGFVRKRFESGTIWEYLIEGVLQHADR